MLRSLVGSEMCIRDRAMPAPPEDEDAYMSSVVAHVAVIAFDHAKGNEVEYFYPDVPGREPGVPEEWANLAFVAMPEAVHNANEDTVFFHLPGLAHGAPHLFGVTCFKPVSYTHLTLPTKRIV
eukprot:TRINITY_DN58289_c0_g1_i1.p2 TRINITY_DN58289_c0_g1~~TRINITY_DN58289_c0_g1_i1.p2  ORF type:complete len:123 (-),score=34.48 TRINITY_DN58289_c0_g1_i1:108-476(-)